ncbi:MAG: c-type cytochrome [Aurantibacter sp.]
MDVFFQSWQKLNSMGVEAQPYLEKIMGNGGSAKARALWLGAKIPNKASGYIKTALTDADPKIRMQGLRMARYLDRENLEEHIALVVNDESIQVRREAAVALRHIGTPKAAELWAVLANQHFDTNRWYLEALGIGSDKYPDKYFEAWKKSVDDDWTNPAGKEIVWRVHAEASVPMLLSMIKDENVDATKLASYFRALSFKKHPRKNEWVAGLLNEKHPFEKDINALAIGQLDAGFVNSSQRNVRMVKNILPQIEGTPEWLFALKNLKLLDQADALFRVVSNSAIAEDLRKEAASLLFRSNGADRIASSLESDSPDVHKMELVGLLGNINDSLAVDLLLKSLTKEDLSFPLKRKSIEALGNTWDGQHRLYDLLKEGKLAEEYKTTAVLRLMNSWDVEIKQNAPKFIEGSSKETIDIDALVERQGNRERGKEIYGTYCASCHVVGSSGTEFGPALSDIGNKLSKRFLYTNITQPSSGISFGYEGYSVKMKDGKTYTGYILSRTEDELTIKMMGGTQTRIDLAEMDNLEAMENSLMTEGLHKVMTEEDLIDLVEYLGTLRVEEEIIASN